jgi:two-component system response regulator YesN
MLIRESELSAGIFDSSTLHKNAAQTQIRTVTRYELEIFHTDTGKSYMDGIARPARRGMLLCAKPGQVRYSDFPVRCSYIRIQPRRNSELDRLLSAAPDCLYIEEESTVEELMGLFAKLCSVLIGADPASESLNTLRANAILLDISYRLGRLWQGSGDVKAQTPIHRLTADTYEYLNEHYAEDCSLKTVAAALHVSPNYLHSVFLREVGVTPFAYVTDKRVRRAKRLIAAGEKPMQEIALEVGFCSQSHFNKVFKEHTGETPASYRRRLLERY